MFRRITILLSIALGSAPVFGQSSGWAFQVKKDPIDDSTRAAAGIKGDRVGLVLWCDNQPPVGDIQAEVNVGEYIGSGNYPVAYRVGSAPPVQDVWTNTFDGRASTIMPASREATARFLAELSKGGNLVIRTDTYQTNAQGVTRSIALPELSTIIARLHHGCVAENLTK